MHGRRVFNIAFKNFLTKCFKKGTSPSMEGTIHTLQDFMFHTETITYLLIVAALIAITGFWIFLTGRDEE
jgi:phosphatidylglycerophosphatase A